LTNPARRALPPDLAGLTLVRVAVPLRHEFRAAHGTEAVRDVVLVRAEGTDGVEGWGECPTLSGAGYVGEDTESAWAALIGDLVPALLRGEEVDTTNRLMAWGGLNDALDDLVLRRAGAPRAGERAGALVPIGAVIGHQPTIADTLAAVAEALEAGCHLVKLKIEPGWDVAVVRAVRGEWPDVPLAADANGSFTLDDLPTLLALDSLGLTYLEQPLTADDLDGLAELVDALETPVALDESIRSAEDLAVAVALRAVDIVNVKPARVGGYASAFALGMSLSDAGIGAFVGGMLETGVGRAGALALAAQDPFVLPSDLGPSSRYFVDDITPAIEMPEPGFLAVPDGPGIGVTPRPERVAELTVAVRSFVL
jgi:O-succinylbenzoate synthase